MFRRLAVACIILCIEKTDSHRTFGCLISWVPAGTVDKPHNGTDVDDRAATDLHHLLSGYFVPRKTGLVDGDIQPSTPRIAD